jgi:hypothetical protein
MIIQPQLHVGMKRLRLALQPLHMFIALRRAG